MPAILKPEAEAEWLNLDTTPEQAMELLRPYPDSEMKAYEISRLINSPTNEPPQVISPLVNIAGESAT
jgi:putative SOS response-associated peptidase YedK